MMEWPTAGRVVHEFAFDPAAPYAAGQHRGVDIAAAPGASILAPISGTVSFAGTVPSHGAIVTITTEDVLAVSLMQLDSVTVTRGTRVEQGDVVGTLGWGGPDSSPPHVHLSVRVASTEHGYLDPVRFLTVRKAASALDLTSRAWLALLLAASATVAVLAYVGVHSPARAGVVVPFLLVFPGLAWARLLRISDRAMTLVLAVALSIVVDTVVPGTLVYAGAWSASTALAVVLAVTVAGGIVEALVRRPPPARSAL
jgi:Peptidase family M23